MKHWAYVVHALMSYRSKARQSIIPTCGLILSISNLWRCCRTIDQWEARIFEIRWDEKRIVILGHQMIECTRYAGCCSHAASGIRLALRYPTTVDDPIRIPDPQIIRDSITPGLLWGTVLLQMICWLLRCYISSSFTPFHPASGFPIYHTQQEAEPPPRVLMNASFLGITTK